MSSDSVNMSGAEGFFGFAPETNKKKQNKEKSEFLLMHQVVKQNSLEHVFDSHTLQSSKYAAGGRDSQALDYKPATE